MLRPQRFLLSPVVVVAGLAAFCRIAKRHLQVAQVVCLGCCRKLRGGRLHLARVLLELDLLRPDIRLRFGARALVSPRAKSHPRLMRQRGDDIGVVLCRLGIVRSLAIGHGADAAEMLAHHEQRTLTVLDGILRFFERGRGWSGHTEGDSSNSQGAKIFMGGVSLGISQKNSLEQACVARQYATAHNQQLPTARHQSTPLLYLQPAPPGVQHCGPDHYRLHSPDYAVCSTHHTVRVWDLPTRIFHWTLAAVIVGSVIRAKIGGNAMAWHFRCGYALLTLLLFRPVWGLVGRHWSHFSAFLYTPAHLLRYLRSAGHPHDNVAHSPLGALSVFGMLAALALQAGTGLFSDDEIFASGALIRFVSNDTVSRASAYHADIAQYLVLALIALPLLAIACYVFAKKNSQVRPMIAGDKLLPTPAPAPRDDAATRLTALAALAVLALFAAAVIWVVRLGGLKCVKARLPKGGPESLNCTH